MTTTLKAALDRAATGLFLMTLFTAIWIGVAEYQLHGSDYGLLGLIFLVILAVFIQYYVKFTRAAKALPVGQPTVPSAEEKREDRWFIIICCAEGVVMFLTANFLVNNQLSGYVIPAMALIVGLHFFPLGFLYKRPFDHVVGAWMVIVALVGIGLISRQFSPVMAAAIAATGSAMGTAAQGLRIIAKRKSVAL